MTRMAARQVPRGCDRGKEATVASTIPVDGQAKVFLKFLRDCGSRPRF